MSAAGTTPPRQSLFGSLFNTAAGSSNVGKRRRNMSTPAASSSSAAGTPPNDEVAAIKQAAAVTLTPKSVKASSSSSNNNNASNSGVVGAVVIQDYKLALDSVTLATTKLQKNTSNELGSGGGRQQISNGMRRVHRILSPEEVAAGRQSRWTELEINGNVKHLSPALWRLRHLTALFLNGNQLSRLPAEISQLCNLVILDVSHNYLRSLPSELGDMISLCHLYLNYNKLKNLPYELGKLFRLQTLGLNGNPLTHEISRIYHEINGTHKLLQHLLDHLAIHTVPPPDRPWMTLRNYNHDGPNAEFTVLCYNVLCDKYATANLYSYCPSWALNWEYRKTLILKEIRKYDADIVTLQEVETEQFHLLFLPELQNDGYTGIFSPKSRAKTMNDEEKKYVDGCAIFWKKEKFELDEEHLIEFNQMAIKADYNYSEQMLNRVMPRDNIALVAVLRLKEAIYSGMVPNNPHENVVGNPLVICTAHIHWDPEFSDVKLIQTMMLAKELAKVVDMVCTRWRSMTPNQVPTLICGDLNSLPNSGVYEFLTCGKIDADHVDYKAFRGETCLRNLSSNSNGDSSSYTHKLKLESAYEIDTMPFTNFTLDFKGVIDYIFSTRNSLCRLGVLGPVDQYWLSQNKIIGCPHPHLPSDHVPLMAHYQILAPAMVNGQSVAGGGGLVPPSLAGLTSRGGPIGGGSWTNFGGYGLGGPAFHHFGGRR